MRTVNETRRDIPSYQQNSFPATTMNNLGSIQKYGGGDSFRPVLNNPIPYGSQSNIIGSTSIPYPSYIQNDSAYQSMLRTNNLRNFVQPLLPQPQTYNLNYAPIELPQYPIDPCQNLPMNNTYFNNVGPPQPYMATTSLYQTVYPNPETSLVFGPPPRRSSKTPNYTSSESIPIESIFQSYSNRMNGMTPQPKTPTVRPDIKLKFSKNVVNIPKIIETNYMEEEAKKIAPVNYNPEKNSTVPFLPQDENAFIEMILEGCLHGEEIATKYQNVPCFKNIKKLCEKTKSDLMTPHCTARNIHSQGIPWATKDYIFAFTRLTSCWYLLKGYLDQKSDVFDKIEQLYSPQLRSSFEAWEQTTSNLAFHIMQSFMALGNPTQTPKLTNRKIQNDDDLRKYIEPGCYPVPQYMPFKKTPQGMGISALMKRGWEEDESKSVEAGGGDWENEGFNKLRLEKRSTCVKKAHKSFFNTILSTQQPKYGGKQQQSDGLSKAASQTFERILNELWNMRSSHYFVFEVDVRDLPDYYDIIKYPMFLTNILQKLQQFKYKSVFQVVHDFRCIFWNARVYLNVHPDRRLERVIDNFSSTFERLLMEYFPRMDFSDVTGESNSIGFNIQGNGISRSNTPSGSSQEDR